MGIPQSINPRLVDPKARLDGRVDLELRMMITSGFDRVPVAIVCRKFVPSTVIASAVIASVVVVPLEKQQTLTCHEEERDVERSAQTVDGLHREQRCGRDAILSVTMTLLYESYPTPDTERYDLQPKDERIAGNMTWSESDNFFCKGGEGYEPRTRSFSMHGASSHPGHQSLVACGL